MKPMTLLIAAVLMSLSSLAIAQSADMRAQQLAEELELDENQTRAIEELMIEHRSSMREQMESQDVRGPERRDHMRAAREELHAEIRKLLTPEQAEKFDQLIADRRGMMAARRDAGQGMRGDRYSSDRRGMRGERQRGRHGMMRGPDGMGMGPCSGPGQEPDFSKLDVDEGMRARLEALHREHRDEMMRMHQRHRDEMRELMGDEEFEKLRSEGVPCRHMDEAIETDEAEDR